MLTTYNDLYLVSPWDIFHSLFHFRNVATWDLYDLIVPFLEAALHFAQREEQLREEEDGEKMGKILWPCHGAQLLVAGLSLWVLILGVGGCWRYSREGHLDVWQCHLLPDTRTIAFQFRSNDDVARLEPFWILSRWIKPWRHDSRVEWLVACFSSQCGFIYENIYRGNMRKPLVFHTNILIYMRIILINY